MSTALSATATIDEVVFTIPVKTSINLLPELLTANESNEHARPAESADERAKRVLDMQASIVANGQLQPVLVIQVDEENVAGEPYTRYEYVDGGCRVEAIAKIREADPKSVQTVWCSVMDASRDLFRDAVISNLHRTQNNLLELAMLCQEVRERNGWKGRGTEAKVASYLGLLPSRVTEYTKLLNAPDSIKDMIRSGELQSLDAVLKLMAQDEESRPKVIARSKEIAKEEAAAEKAAKADKKDKGKKGKESNDASASVSSSDAVGVVADNSDRNTDSQDAVASAPIKSRHIERATREVVESSGPIKRTRSELIGFFEQVTEAAYPKHVVAFTDAFVKWAAGELKTDSLLLKKFDAACGLAVASSKPAKPAKTKAAAKTKK